MATTLKLPFTRFVAQVNTAPAEPKANYQALSARNALALQSCEWREAAKSAKASLVTHNFTISHSGDQYDAYLMTGDYNADNSTEVAYAGMAAYRFTLPAAYISGSQTLVSMSLPITRDRFLLPGVRVVAVLSDSTQPSASWAAVRGEASSAASETEYLKNSATRITAALDDSGTLALDLTGTDTTKKSYLWIYLTVEDYAATWTMYSKTEPRLYAIEGSAMIVGEDVTVTFSADVTPDAGISYGELNLYTGEYTKWIDLPDDTMESACDTGELAVTDEGGGSARFVAICGENVPSSMPSIPGWALYDVQNNRFISFAGMPVYSYATGGAEGSTDMTADLAAYFKRNGGVRAVHLYARESASFVTVSCFLVPLFGHRDYGLNIVDRSVNFRYYPSTGDIVSWALTPNVISITAYHPMMRQDPPDKYSKAVMDSKTVGAGVSVTESGVVSIWNAKGHRTHGVMTAGAKIDWVSPLPQNYRYGEGKIHVVGTFVDFFGVTCNGMAVISYDSVDSMSVQAAYPLPLVFDSRKNLTFHGSHDDGLMFVTGDFTTINGVKANGCALIKPCPAGALLDPSDPGYIDQDWRDLILPLTCGMIEKPAGYNLNFNTNIVNIGTWADADPTCSIACLRRDANS